MSKSNRSLLAMLASNQSSSALAAGYSLSSARAAGYSLSDARAAGYSLSDALAAGYSLSSALAAGYSLSSAKKLEEKIPLIEKPYTALWNDIQAKKRRFQQSTWGPEKVEPEANICNTAMCTAGHLVNMAGTAGYTLKDAFGWKIAGALIHYKAHPDWPCQNFGSIPDAWALAYIEEMAERESAES